MATDWAAHLAAFHAARPGITEDVLARCRADGHTPYTWLVDGVPPHVPMVDLACGSGPTRPPGATAWVGLDLAPAELARARAAGRTAIARADIARLPVPDRSVDVVTCSMAMMLVADVDAALAEARRVLTDDGELRLLLPARGPLRPVDRWRHARLMVAARAVPSWPPTPMRRRAHEALARAGLTVVGDAARRFVLDLATADDAARYVDSWYRPGADEVTLAAAARRAGRRSPLTLGVPFRRVVARPSSSSVAARPGPRPG